MPAGFTLYQTGRDFVLGKWTDDFDVDTYISTDLANPGTPTTIAENVSRYPIHSKIPSLPSVERLGIAPNGEASRTSGR